MNEIQIFENTQFGPVRTLDEGGKTLFCGSDLAKALGYAKPQNAIDRHCRCALKRGIPHPQSPDKTIEMVFITEGDIYRLAAKSELPGADEFERWIFDEVIPAIRKHGSYSVKKPMTDYQQKMIETRERNSRIQASRILERMAARYKGTT